MIWGIKGLYATAKTASVNSMLKCLRQKEHRTKTYKYQKLLPWHTYHFSKINNIVSKLQKQLKHGDTIIAHSYGCAIVYLLLKALQDEGSELKLKRVYLFNPAIDKDLIIPESHFEECYIFFDPKDQLLRLAQWLPFNIIGSMGKYGYRYPSEKIHNKKIKKTKYKTTKFLFFNSHHRNAFQKDTLPYYCNFISKKELK